MSIALGAVRLKTQARFASRRGVFVCLVAGLILAPALFGQGQDVSVGETPEQANARIRALSAGTRSISHDYVIGRGDLLSILVFDVPELTREVRVSQSGTISIPLVPTRLQVAGLTEIQTEQKITEVLEANGLVSHPEVGVTVKEHRSRPITIVGAVAHPMVYEADRDVTLLEALAEAGGISNDAGDTVIVTRSRTATFTEVASPGPVTSGAAPGAGEPPELDSSAAPGPAQKTDAPSAVSPAFPSAPDAARNSIAPATPNENTPESAAANLLTINLNELLESGDARNNIPLQGGDIITVPHAGIVYVLGAVNRPGGFVVSNDRTQLTTLKVLSLAGGLTKIAKLSHAYIIRKDDQGKQVQTEVDLKKILDRKAEDLTMRASDVLYIPDDRSKEVLFRAAEMGLAVGSAIAIFRLAYH